jgi:hypothetical protein
MDQKIAVVWQRLGVDKILLGGVVARRAAFRCVAEMLAFDALPLPLSRQGEGASADSIFSERAHFVLDRNRDDVLECGNYGMGRCA